MSVDIYTNFVSGLSDIERKHAPDLIYTEGNLSLLSNGKKVSIVGSRKVSEHGAIRTSMLTKFLVNKGITIVSGLAEGVDTIAHETAIECGGKTIAVLGTPLSKTFPAKNKDLLQEIKTNHLAVSQFAEGSTFNKGNFPSRNRTMALISDATIIIEASEKSGTRHQGWEAIRLGRLLFILDNVASDKRLSWPSKMIHYGAQVLTRENLEESIDLIPEFTSSAELLF